ncbi:MAG: protein-export membrane protein SecF [Actinobacteria bacterium RBG_13_63_9]|nr:MAG: protein-export membrane protein SecF [Actinobacteria bacterium RBG_13_63_9]
MRVYHFMRYKWWFLGSLTAVTIFAVVTVFIVGLDLGIDFRGGVRMQFTLEQQATVDDIRSVVSEVGVQEPIVQSVGTPGTASAFMVTAEEMTTEQMDDVESELNSRYGLDEESKARETVGASFGRETTNKAFIAVAIAIVLIIAYLSFRFEIKFAIPAILALIHDVGLTLGIYAASNRLVTSATVAAILTILGYSVHDTIIVFDRMRENTLLMRKETYGDMVDLSIRQTMIRSINTTIAILLPLVAILVFGGPTLKDFAMALTIGVVAGTYSSFFVAAPLVTIWKEREPRYRKRLALAGAGGQTAIDEGPSGKEDRPLSSGAAVSGGAAVVGKTISRKPGQTAAASKPTKGKAANRRPAGKKRKRTSR